MVSSSKILTVSYGTFSCTAEGFEDPLDVVKETTHFFRGVVRDDRFFGAEPPQFDPEMAAEILQAQLAPTHGEGQLTLRNSFGAASAGAMTAALAAGPMIPRNTVAEPAPSPTDANDQAPAGAEDAPIDDPVHEDVTSEVLAALDREEHVDHAGEPDMSLAPVDLAPEDTASDSIASLIASETMTTESVEDLGMPDSGSAPVPPTHSLADPETVSAKLQRIRDVVAQATSSPVQADEAETLADNLFAETTQDSTAETESYEDSYEEDLDDEMFFDTESDDALSPENALADDVQPVDYLDAALFDDAQDVAEGEAPELAEFTQSDAVDAQYVDARDMAEDDLAEDLFADEELAGDETIDAPLGYHSDLPAETQPVATADAPVLPETEVDETPRTRARVVKVKRTAFDAAVTGGQLASDHADGADTISSLSSEDEDDLARELAAVRAELQAGFAEAWGDEDTQADEIAPQSAAPLRRAETKDDWLLGGGWEDDRDDDVTEIAPAEAPVQAAAMLQEQAPIASAETLPPMPVTEPVGAPMTAAVADAEDDDSIAALQGAMEDTHIYDDEGDEDMVAETAADTQGDVEEDTDARSSPSVTADFARMAQEEVRKAIKMSSPGRVMLTETGVEDNDASRILDETNSQLREPEGNRRRSAIAHLRAAVAATRADRRLGRKKDVEKASEPYREDLADVVRPRRPEAPAIHTDRPVEQSRAAPLKLVAEQRVDQERAPTRPRRVRVAEIDDDMAGSESGFADYADSVGARDLPELLEAAAAYMSFVERREQFSRPQLMTKVRQAEQRESSREDRLRTFGQLLREGKIEKTRGGRFTASERISFKPDARAAG